MTAFVDAHRETLDRALAAIADRSYWSNYPESPSPRVYGEDAAADGLAAYEAHLGHAVPARPAGHRRLGRRRALAVRVRSSG